MTCRGWYRLFKRVVFDTLHGDESSPLHCSVYRVVPFIGTGCHCHAAERHTGRSLHTLPHGKQRTTLVAPKNCQLSIVNCQFIAPPPCLSLWERWPSAARTERVNVHDTNIKRRKALSVTFGDSSPRGRAKGAFSVCAPIFLAAFLPAWEGPYRKNEKKGDFIPWFTKCWSSTPALPLPR